MLVTSTMRRKKKLSTGIRKYSNIFKCVTEETARLVDQLKTPALLELFLSFGRKAKLTNRWI